MRGATMSSVGKRKHNNNNQNLKIVEMKRLRHKKKPPIDSKRQSIVDKEIEKPIRDSCEKQTKSVPASSFSEQIPCSSMTNQFEDKSVKHSSALPPKNQVQEELVETAKSVIVETMPTVSEATVTLNRMILTPNEKEDIEQTGESENSVHVSEEKCGDLSQTKFMEKVIVDEIQPQHSEPQSISACETSVSETIINNNKLPELDQRDGSSDVEVSQEEEINVCEMDSKNSCEEQSNNGLAMVNEVTSTGSNDCLIAEENPVLVGNGTEQENEVEHKYALANQDEESSSVTSSVNSPTIDPSINGINGTNSDEQSEWSVDGGSAGKLVATNDQSHLVSYMFNFPAKMVGMLIGRSGRNIKELKRRSGCQIYVKHKLSSPDLNLICLEGSKEQVECALDQIRRRFPPHKFGMLDFSEVKPEQPVLAPNKMQLSLPEVGIVDVNVSSVVTPNHIFLQQPTYPSFFTLDQQNQVMNRVYCDSAVPQLPTPIKVGMICVAPMVGGWYRAMVVAVDETEDVEIKYLDYGGFAKINSRLLKQIRSDFTSMPFQGVECYLANVIPPKDMDTFPAEINAILEKMVCHKLMKAEVASYNEGDGIPYIHLYHTLPDGSLKMVNRELVDMGVASWLEHSL